MTIIPVQYKQFRYHGTMLTVPYDTKWLAIDPTGCVVAFYSEPEVCGNDWHQDNALAVVGSVIEPIANWHESAVPTNPDPWAGMSDQERLRGDAEIPREHVAAYTALTQILKGDF